MAEFEEEVEEISPEEKLQICQHYLLSSPPGQFKEVLSDVRKLIPSDLLSDALAGGIARVANLKNFAVVTAPSGKKTILSSAGEIDPSHYFDPVTGSVIGVDHLSLMTEETSLPSNQSQSLEISRVAIQEALNKYIKIAYPAEQSAAGVFTKDEQITIVISGEKTNLRNFWSGRWTSSWNLSLNDGSAELTGDLKLHIHYFEDGNLQLQGSKSIPGTAITYTSEAELGEKVVAAIQANENTLQSSLEEMYTSMNEETLKAMRRIMPITRTKMEWNVNAVRMVRQVRK